ncbi:MAG: hypothetical protein WCI72_01860 [archaeon]
MNKKASEKINAAMYILYLVIIAGGVTILIGSYLNTPVDVRPLESQILYDRLMNCFAKDGFVKDGVLSSDFSVFLNCHINETMIARSNLYFEFQFLNETGGEIRNSFKGGIAAERNAKKLDCEVFARTDTKNAPSCIFRNETYLYSNVSVVKNLKIVGWVASNNAGVRDA